MAIIPLSAPRLKRVVPLIVAVALLMENVDSSVLSTSLPAMAVDLATDPIHLKLVLTSYLLALAVFIPASGWAADRFGARVVSRFSRIAWTEAATLIVRTAAAVTWGHIVTHHRHAAVSVNSIGPRVARPPPHGPSRPSPSANVCKAA